MADRPSGGFDRWSGRVTTWLARGGAVALTFMMLLTFCDVVGRAFDQPIVFTVEATELAMGLVVYLGIGMTTYSRGHISVDIVVLRLPPRVRAGLEVLTLGVCIVLTVLICWRLWIRAGTTFDKNDLTQIMEWPIWPVAYVMAAASILLVTSLALQFAQAVRALAGPADPSQS